MFNSERSFSLTREEACDKLLRLYKSYYNIHRFDGGESAVREGSTAKGKTDEEVSRIVRRAAIRSLPAVISLNIRRNMLFRRRRSCGRLTGRSFCICSAFPSLQWIYLKDAGIMYMMTEWSG